MRLRRAPRPGGTSTPLDGCSGRRTARRRLRTSIRSAAAVALLLTAAVLTGQNAGAISRLTGAHPSYAVDSYVRSVAVVTTADGVNVTGHLARHGYPDDRYLERFRHENPPLAAELEPAFAAAKAFASAVPARRPTATGPPCRPRCCAGENFTETARRAARRLSHSAAMNLRRSAPTLALAGALTVLLMGAVGMASVVRDIPARLLIGDPAALVDAPFYLGAVTLLRSGLLAAAAGGCLTAAWVLRGRAARDAEFLAALGTFLAALAVDDKFQIHEAVLGQVLGVPELLTFAAIGAVALGGTVRYRDRVRRHPEGWVLLAGLALLGCAVAADQVFDAQVNAFVESSFEVAGLACLCLFGIRASTALLLDAVSGTAPTSPHRKTPTVGAEPSPAAGHVGDHADRPEPPAPPGPSPSAGAPPGLTVPRQRSPSTPVASAGRQPPS
jgi:hypothetical protein